VKKKTREFKNNLIEQIRQSVDNYANIFVYGIENMRGTQFVEVSGDFFICVQGIGAVT
jgi:ribosomal protein L10